MENGKRKFIGVSQTEPRRSFALSSLRQFYSEDKGTDGSSTFPFADSTNTNNAYLWKAATPIDLPLDANFPIITSLLLDRKVIAAMTGPDRGFQAAREWQNKTASKTLVYGNHVIIDDWKEIPHERACGKSISLYDTNPVTGRTSGDPIADAFVLKVRSNSAFLAVADGVNWGEASMQAARCAINAVYVHLESSFFLGGPESLKIRTTRDAANLLFSAFHQAHLDIISQTSGLTTLCVGVLLPVHMPDRHRTRPHNWRQSSCSVEDSAGKNGASTRQQSFALVVASVGDSQAFVLRGGTTTVEVTGWVGGITGGNDLEGHGDGQAEEGGEEAGGDPPERDFRDAGGALGAVHTETKDPELQNLMCAVTICNLNDIIIFGTDGLTDNFDPVVARLAIPQSPAIEFADDFLVGGNKGKIETNSIGRHSSHVWTDRVPISSPYSTNIWPTPPPPPPTSISLSSPVPSLEKPKSSNRISACSLNYTDQLELSWPERRQYASKELTRLWYELEQATGENFRAEKFAESLLKHARRVTAQKRQLLESPETTKLKAQFSRYMRKKNSARETTAHIDNKDLDLKELERRKAWVMDRLKKLPGKLDHATVVILQVGEHK